LPAADGLGWFGKASAIGPREWPTLHLDRASVRMIQVFQSNNINTQTEAA
jgi:hypothetical protein